MRFKQYLTEKRKNNIIVVDVQPMYEQFINFEIEDFNKFLKEQGNILYYYNGPDTVGVDSERDIIQWLCEYSGDWDEELYTKLTNKRQTIWYDKGYAFFRNWMDMGADIGFIKKAIRFMLKNKVWDSREIEPEVWEKEFSHDWSDDFEMDNINIPDIPLNILKKFSGSYIVGGGKNECLKEVQILMSAFNIKAKVVRDFIF